MKKTKPKPQAKERQLSKEWQDILKRHSAPFGKGRASVAFEGKLLSPVVTTPVTRLDHRALPSLRMEGVATTPAVDPLSEAKSALKWRVGQAFNKAGPSYLTDDELEEQRGGTHRRRG